MNSNKNARDFLGRLSLYIEGKLLFTNQSNINNDVIRKNIVF